jgi:hypothetical protein
MLTAQRIRLMSGQEPVFRFDKDLATFTAGMATRNSGGPFAAGVLVQGKMDGTGTGDRIYLSPGTAINGYFYQNIDAYQGSVVFWVTPEWNGNDNIQHRFWTEGNGAFYCEKKADNKLHFRMNMISGGTDISAWVAGTTYQVTLRWDCKNTIDGTNYMCISINDVHAFSGIALPAPSISTINIGCYPDSSMPLNAIIEGLHIFRRVLWDGSWGCDVGNGDELALIYGGGV